MEMNAREARRKRILDRRSDRLALISGRIQTLPSSSSQPRHSQADASSSQPSLFQDHDLSHQSNVAPKITDDTPDTALSKQETTNESSGSAAVVDSGSVDPQSHNFETYLTTTKTPALDISSKAQPSSSSSAFPNSSNSEPCQHVEPKVHHPRLFTAKKISSSISVTENTRVLCSVALALLVVFSHLNLPLFGSEIVKTIISTRPLYLLLLTNISIVLAPLFLNQVGSHKPEEEEEDGARKAPTEDGNSQAEAVGKALEVALVLYKVLNAAFMDCSIYAVVVVCGFSLGRL